MVTKSSTLLKKLDFFVNKLAGLINKYKLNICMNYANRGMYAETIINRTIDYYKSKNIAIFYKRSIPFQIIEKLNNEKFLVKPLGNALVDYYGIYQGRHIEFEVKQTNDSIFKFNLLKKHQLDYLSKISEHQGLCFLIIYF